MKANASEKKTSQTRIYAYWMVLFAIVGIMDCSCFCYCHYYQTFYPEDSSTRRLKKTKAQKSCRAPEGWQEQHSRLKDDNLEEVDTVDMNTDSHITNKRFSERKAAAIPREKQGIFSAMWKSIVFAYHSIGNPSHAKDVKSSEKKEMPYRLPEENGTTYYHAFLLLHLMFGLFCGVEMIIRAIEARRVVSENQAIAAFEESIASTVAKVYERRKLLGGNMRFSHFVLGRPSDGTIVSSPTTTRTIKRNVYSPFSPSNETSTTKRNLNDTNGSSSSSSSNHNETIKNNDTNDGNTDDAIDIDNEAANKRSIILFLRSTFGLWLPIGITCLFWLSLFPFQSYCRILRIFLSDYYTYIVETISGNGNVGWDKNELVHSDYHCDTECNNPLGPEATASCYVQIMGEDTAWATISISVFVTKWKQLCKYFEDYYMYLWKEYLLGNPFHTEARKKLHKVLLDRPKLIWFRLGRFLKIVKWIRFAFPLTRMSIKLQDQLYEGYSTFRKVRSVKSKREERLQRPSLLWRDLQRIESFHKIETTIAALPSQCNMMLEALAKEVSGSKATIYAEEFLRKSRERGTQISRQIQLLQRQLKRSMNDFSPSEIYDNIIHLSKDISKRHLLGNQSNLKQKEGEGDEDITKANKKRDSSRSSLVSTKSRWYDCLHLETLLSSRALISPRSRFSVVWRITVTNCLLLELTRLLISWYMTQTFHLSISQLIGRLFVDCGNIEEDTKRKFKFFTNLIEGWHIGLSRAIPFVPFPKKSLYVLCVPTSHFSKFLLLLGSIMETFIDVVSFLDIFFWFFTGDLDIYTGSVIPKGFFKRCILPGTLVQIIDHPTLPHFLPSLLGKFASIATEIGWSRLLLWSFAVFPALVVEVIMPLIAYLFRHLEETDTGDDDCDGDNTDFLMTYAQSLGVLPTRNSQILEMTATPFWLKDDSVDDKRIQTHLSKDNNVDNEFNDDSRIDSSALRSSSYGSPVSPALPGILTSPGSPKRKFLKESNVRFETGASLASIGDASPQIYGGSSTEFDIGLSLSSHDLDDLDDLK